MLLNEILVISIVEMKNVVIIDPSKNRNSVYEIPGLVNNMLDNPDRETSYL